MVKVQDQTKGAVKDSVNPFFKSDYATFTSVWDACSDALHKNGLSVIKRHTWAVSESNFVVQSL